MIEIHPLRDKDKLKTLYSDNNIEMTENSIAVVASDSNEVLGFCLFEMNTDNLLIHTIEPKDDKFLADGILRSALHVGVENGIMTAFYSINAPESLFSALAFIKNIEKRELNVEKLFSSCKNCGND